MMSLIPKELAYLITVHITFPALCGHFSLSPAFWASPSTASFHFLFAPATLEDLVTNGFCCVILLAFIDALWIFSFLSIKILFTCYSSIKMPYAPWNLLSFFLSEWIPLFFRASQHVASVSRYSSLIFPCNTNCWMYWILGSVKTGIMSLIRSCPWLTYSRYLINICWNEILKEGNGRHDTSSS